MELWPAGRLWWSMGTVIIGAPRTTAPYPYGDSGCEPLAVDRGSARGGKRMKYDEGGSWRDVACRRRSRRKQRRERVDQGRTPARHGLARDAERSGGRRGGAQRARAKNAPLSVLDRTADAQPRAARAEREPPPARRGRAPRAPGPRGMTRGNSHPTTNANARAAARRGARRAARR